MKEAIGRGLNPCFWIQKPSKFHNVTPSLTYNIRECYVNWNFHHFSSPLGIAWIIAKEWSRLLETFRFYNLNLIDAFHIGSVSTDSPRDEILIFLSHYQPPKVSLSIIINNCLWVPWNSTLLYLILFPPGSFIMQLLGQVPSASFTAGMYWLSSFSFVLNYNLHSCIWGEWLEERNSFQLTCSFTPLKPCMKIFNCLSTRLLNSYSRHGTLFPSYLPLCHIPSFYTLFLTWINYSSDPFHWCSQRYHHIILPHHWKLLLCLMSNSCY